MNQFMPIKGKPYAHQRAAFEFALNLFGLIEGGDVKSISGGCAYLMEFQTYGKYKNNKRR